MEQLLSNPLFLLWLFCGGFLVGYCMGGAVYWRRCKRLMMFDAEQDFWEAARQWRLDELENELDAEESAAGINRRRGNWP